MRTIDGKYEVVRTLGAGGMGSVVEARHLTTGRRVAVKLILEEARLEASVVARFEREARAAGAVESDHITQVLDAGVDAATDAPYLVMELLDGEDVDALFKRLGPLRSDLALRIVAQTLAGLARAHDAGVVHRDVKPANVFLAHKEGGAVIAKVCDFGIAKVKADPLASGSGHQLTRSSSLLGSPTYMSPEQAKGAKDVDARSDVWSAGVVLYQLLSGTTPHQEADTLGLLLLAICSTPAPPLQSRAPWVSSDVAAIVARALELDPQARYGSARAMLEAIAILLPSGSAMDRSMLTPMGDEERAHVAAPAVASLALAGAEDASLPPPLEEVRSATAGAYTKNAAAAPSARPIGRWALAAGLALVAAAGGVGLATGGADARRQATSLPPPPGSSFVAPSGATSLVALPSAVAETDAGSSLPIASAAPTPLASRSAAVGLAPSPRPSSAAPPASSQPRTPLAGAALHAPSSPPAAPSAPSPSDDVRCTFR